MISDKAHNKMLSALKTCKAAAEQVISERDFWKSWATKELSDYHRQAVLIGADYLGLTCPSCGRLRLEPKALSIKCEKCGWFMAVVDEDDPTKEQ